MLPNEIPWESLNVTNEAFLPKIQNLGQIMWKWQIILNWGIFYSITIFCTSKLLVFYMTKTINKPIEICSTSLIIREMHIKTEVPQEIRNRTTAWYNNPICGYISKRTKSRVLKKYSHTTFIIAYSQQLKDGNNPISVSRWMDKI